MEKSLKFAVFGLVFILLGFGVWRLSFAPPSKPKSGVKLYWFIPDGLRAEPELFKIFDWAEHGELPNLKRMMELGSYGYSIPVFPSHTPVNFATLLTGTYPRTHGVADGPMHGQGLPLDKVSISGFSSLARKIPAVWTQLENRGYRTAVVSTPGSTPPEIRDGAVIRGRWGGWGHDVHALIFQGDGAGVQRGRGNRLFFLGPQLTQYVGFEKQDWLSREQAPIAGRSFVMEGWGVRIYGALTGQAKAPKPEAVAFSFDRKSVVANLKEGQWSDWIPVSLNENGLKIESHIRLHVIKLGAHDFFRIRVLFDGLNSTVVQPPELAGELVKALGPMVDFVDNYPPQLVRYDEDKSTFLEEMEQSFAWHTRFISQFVQMWRPNVVIHNIYDPNQMLTSRWWMGAVEPSGLDYQRLAESERLHRWEEVKAMYKSIDLMLGEILKVADENTVIVFGSDHGVSVLRTAVRLNNFFAQKGWLKFKISPETGEPQVDWAHTQVIFLKMDGIYIRPDGLNGNWTRGSGTEYETLRQKVQSELNSLQTAEGVRPVAKVVKWEDANQVLSLPSDRVGDLIVANAAGFGWDEEMSNDLKIFAEPVASGYKQAILPDEVHAMWTPFVIIGPGVRKNHKLSTIVKQVDQLPTLLKAMGEPPPNILDGHVVDEVFE